MTISLRNEFEEAILGCLMMSNSFAKEILPILSISNFMTSFHREIYQAIIDLHSQEIPTDILLVQNRILSNRSGMPIKQEWLLDIYRMASHSPPISNALHYVKILIDMDKNNGNIK